MPFALRVVISALLIALVSELAKRNPLLGALFAPVPLVSVLAMIWLYLETRDVDRISVFAQDVFWSVLPSLVTFLLLLVLLRAGVAFFPALFTFILATGVLYLGMLRLLGRAG